MLIPRPNTNEKESIYHRVPCISISSTFPRLIKLHHPNISCKEFLCCLYLAEEEFSPPKKKKKSKDLIGCVYGTWEIGCVNQKSYIFNLAFFFFSKLKILCAIRRNPFWTWILFSNNWQVKKKKRSWQCKWHIGVDVGTIFCQGINRWVHREEKKKNVKKTRKR